MRAELGIEQAITDSLNSASMNSTKTSLKISQKKKDNCVCTEYIQIFLSLFPKYNKAIIYTTVTLNEVSEVT